MKRILLACLALVFASIAVAGDDASVGISEFKAGKFRASLKHLEPAAEAGDAAAQLYMGRLYSSGRAGVMDDFEAANWFEKAARQGNAAAQYHLGRSYLAGWGVEKSPTLAREWLWKSGQSGYLKAQLLLGKLLSEGGQLDRDLDAARLWYAQAASKGSVEARDKLEQLGGAEALPDGGRAMVTETAMPSASDADGRSPEVLVEQRLAEVEAAQPAGEGGDRGGEAVTVDTDVVADELEPDTAGAEELDGLMEIDELVLEDLAKEGEMDSANPAMDTAIDEPEVRAEGVAEEVVVEEAAATEATEEKVADEDVVSPEEAEVAAASAATETPAAQASPDEDALKGREWVLSRKPSHYTIQLLGAWNQAEVLDFVKKNPLPGPGAVVESKRRGRAWFLLYYGDFPNYAAVLKAHGALKGGIAKHGPWVRPFKKIQPALRK